MLHHVFRQIWHFLVVLRLKDIAPIVISLVALYVSLRDRRPRLILRERKGTWCTLSQDASHTEVIFRGIVEAYNASSRANAIRGYSFWCKRPGTDEWEAMESELYHQVMAGEPVGRNNVTPITLAPYSGIEVRVFAFTHLPQPDEMPIRIEVEDLFGKRYRVEVTARS